jgi:hypothetical protein
VKRSPSGTAPRSAKRADVDDGATTCGEHRRHRRVQCIAQRVDIAREHGIPRVIGARPDDAGHRETAGQIEKRIERTKSLEAEPRRNGIGQIDPMALVIRRCFVVTLRKRDIKADDAGAVTAGDGSDDPPQRTRRPCDHHSFPS